MGLARHDFVVTATDLSPKSVERARKEAEKLGIPIDFEIADFRSLEQDIAGQFDVVLSADNAIPHLLSDEELRQACRNLYAKLRNEGRLSCPFGTTTLLFRTASVQRFHESWMKENVWFFKFGTGRKVDFTMYEPIYYARNRWSMAYPSQQHIL
ncbi:class I SAM-dependent methyltransferase [Paenibacillus lautus]|uniref:class I SAM-dependent methyltransferase n=1 Tax=Paenibacillus lautus TaxID=1401 RepID=UPI0026BB541F